MELVKKSNFGRKEKRRFLKKANSKISFRGKL